MSRKTDSGNLQHNKLPVYLTVLGIFVALWIGLMSQLFSILRAGIFLNDRLHVSVLVTAILLVSYIVIVYIVTILKAVFCETTLLSMNEIDKRKLRAQRARYYKEVMQGWFFYFVVSVYLVISAVISPYMGFTWTIVILLIFFLTLISFIWQNIYNLLKKNEQAEFRRSLSIGYQISNTWKNWYNALSFWFRHAFFFIIYLLLVSVFTSGVQITFNETVYANNDSPIVVIKPYGLLAPKIDIITYSNEYIELYNGSSPFPRSPRVIKIPSEHLTIEPYNSFITVNASLFDSSNNLLLRNTYVVSVPVYK